MGGDYRICFTPGRRATIALIIRDENTVEVRYPAQMPRVELTAFVKEHENWIRSALQKWRAEHAEAAGQPPLDYAEIQRLAELAMKDLPPRINSWARQLGVQPTGVTIRNQRTRWGSCSAQGRLNLNCLLMLAPETVREYVVVHELCHLKEMNHSPQFWALVKAALPDYKQSIQWLKTHGSALILRMTAGGEG